MVKLTNKKLHPTIERLYSFIDELDIDERDKSNKQNYVANKFNCSAQQVNNWETRGISTKYAIQAQRSWGCDAVWVFYGDEPNYSFIGNRGVNGDLDGESAVNQNLTTTLNNDILYSISNLDKPSIKLLNEIIESFVKCDMEYRERIEFNAKAALDRYIAVTNSEKAKEKIQREVDFNADSGKAKKPKL